LFETVCGADLLSSSARHLHSREISREAFGVRQSAAGPIRRGEIDAALTFYLPAFGSLIRLLPISQFHRSARNQSAAERVIGQKLLERGRRHLLRSPYFGPPGTHSGSRLQGRSFGPAERTYP